MYQKNRCSKMTTNCMSMLIWLTAVLLITTEIIPSKPGFDRRRCCRHFWYTDFNFLSVLPGSFALAIRLVAFAGIIILLYNQYDIQYRLLLQQAKQ